MPLSTRTPVPVVYSLVHTRGDIQPGARSSFADAVIWAKNEAHLIQLKGLYEIPANAPVVIPAAQSQAIANNRAVGVAVKMKTTDSLNKNG
jgi:hypothetical protein